jgi:NADH:ubiquinone oxidoreductase subunit 6 (subunit J)
VHAIVGSFTTANASFLVMNPDFYFVLAMDVIVFTAGVGHVLRTGVMLKDVIKVSLLQNDRIKKIISIFYGIQCSLNNFELSATIIANSIPDNNTSVGMRC